MHSGGLHTGMERFWPCSHSRGLPLLSTTTHLNSWSPAGKRTAPRHSCPSFQSRAAAGSTCCHFEWEPGHDADGSQHAATWALDKRTEVGTAKRACLALQRRPRPQEQGGCPPASGSSRRGLQTCRGCLQMSLYPVFPATGGCECQGLQERLWCKLRSSSEKYDRISGPPAVRLPMP